MLLIKKFFGLVKKALGLVYTSNNLLEWQAVKLTFFAPCCPRLSDSNKTSQANFLLHDCRTILEPGTGYSFISWAI